jgi:ribosomal protein L5
LSTTPVVLRRRLNASEVEKKDLFLFMLALEHLSGGAPVSFTRLPTTRSKTAASGVTCTITGADAFTFLEKLINVVLPNQVGNHVGQ